MARRIAGTIIVEGTDDEFWPWNDQHIRESHSLGIILNTNQPISTNEIPDVRWGGECRVEVRIIARLFQENSVQIEVRARFFEGMSEDTTELADEQTLPFTVPPDARPVHQTIQLRNTEAGGGDHAEIYLSFTNTLAGE
jgi:hypothetical protein